MIDVAAERLQTAGSDLASHFNAAGAALPSRGVIDVVVQHLRLEESIGGYEAAAQERPRVEAIYDSAARLVNARRDEIALLDSATTGLRVLVEALRPTHPRRIIATSSTYVSHALHLLTLAKEQGVELLVAPTGSDRQVDLEALDRLLAEGPPTIVTAAHIPTSSGLVEPVAQIGALVKSHGGLYLLDATQSVGHLDVDVEAIGCDMLVTTGRKFLRAPRGTGFAYVRAELARRLVPNTPDVRASQWTSAFDWDVEPSARRFETWESAVAARLGLGAAIDEALARGVESTAQWLVHAGRAIRSGLAQIQGVTVADPLEAPSAIVTFVVDGVDAGEVVAHLAGRGVRVVSVPATHGQWDLGERGITAVVRASAHVYNDENDVAALLDGVAALASKTRAAV
ncbi:aminotransferase class V-fold PLP-dependent enzyme [Gryllotalpicola koreensis]|uniref:aminotransferase class V-fold PLP-dependent enzyme n=1 Tax=Gryllotalpicola koreensis TaxID=993086 RepID=UPI0031D604FF